MENNKKDLFRTNMGVKIFCSKHTDTELKFSSSLMKVGYSSAYEVNLSVVVHPCEKCEREKEKIVDAIQLFNSIAKNGI